MPDYTPYLLYTDEQIQDFRRRYATFIGQKEHDMGKCAGCW